MYKKIIVISGQRVGIKVTLLKNKEQMVAHSKISPTFIFFNLFLTVTRKKNNKSLFRCKLFCTSVS